MRVMSTAVACGLQGWIFLDGAWSVPEVCVEARAHC